jgi:hypothetical protein
MKFTSWRTTAGGIGTILGGVSGAIKLYLSGNITEAVTLLIGSISTGLALICARDNNVPSSAVPKAAEKDAQIKGDTTMITKP